MYFEKVVARDFGPLHAQSLEFGRQMNVVYGPNEAGKSSWHSALYAGLCGLRRGRGRLDVDDTEFRNHHRPWEAEAWAVATIICLSDGRRLELEQDLDAKTGKAIDLALGRDCSNEVVFEGAMDGSGWLGLNRRVFLATACVKQTDLLAVLRHPEVLQEQLQRAADTAGVDATAARALQILESFRQTQVGSDRANATGPLRRGLNLVEQRVGELEAARGKHDEYQRLAEQADRAEATARVIDAQLTLAEARRLRDDAAIWQRRVERAQGLHALFPSGPPPSPTREDDLARQVAEGLSAWETRPSAPVFEGRTAAELRAQLFALPQPPEGDLEIPPDVKGHADRLRSLSNELSRQMGSRPPEPEEAPSGGASAQDLESLADALDAPEPSLDSGLEERINQLQGQLESMPAGRGSWGLTAVGVVVTLASFGLVVWGASLVGTVIALAALLFAVWAWPRANHLRLKTEVGLGNATKEQGQQRFAVEEVRRKREEALRKAGQLGLSPESQFLRELGAQVVAVLEARRALELWHQKEQQLQLEISVSRQQLVEALDRRGASSDGDPIEAVDAYEQACRQRAMQAAKASRRAGLEAQVHDRDRLEQTALEAAKARSHASALIQALAAQCLVVSGAEEEIVEGLKAWQRRHASEVAASETANREWTELQGLLDGASLEEVKTEARRRTGLAETRAAGLAPDAIGGLSPELGIEQEIANLRKRLGDANEERDKLRGQLQLQASWAIGVPEAEEALAGAREELQRVQATADILERTQSFLERAQDKVHRDIAPVLAASVRECLSSVTGGRYAEVLVDPESLDVQIRPPNGIWRRATLLSHGTAEQVYFLLRVALARHLTKQGEHCPLLLDDVTTQSDAKRTIAILNTLHALSADRQIILFTQESEVLEWARGTLIDATRDRLVELAGPLGSA